jgi:uncharacterized protein (TIGR00369 family)
MTEGRELRRRAVADLGTALRELVDAAVLTEAPIEELAVVADVAVELTARLREQSRALHEIASVDDPSNGERWYNPVYGLGNPVAPPMAVEVEDGRAIGRVTLRKPHEGPPGLVHGGVVATMLDHVLGHAVRASGRGGVTASLTVRFRRPVRLGMPLVAMAELTGTDGRRTTVTARLVTEEDPDVALATAEGQFVALRPEQAADMFAATGRDVGAWTARS